MKKILKNILITFATLGAICFAFMIIGWLTSISEVGMMFIIAVCVIAVNILASFAWKMIKSHFDK